MKKRAKIVILLIVAILVLLGILIFFNYSDIIKGKISLAPQVCSETFCASANTIESGKTGEITINLNYPSLTSESEIVLGVLLPDGVSLAGQQACSCDGKSCGDDGCGNSCGACLSEQVCSTSGTCIALGATCPSAMPPYCPNGRLISVYGEEGCASSTCCGNGVCSLGKTVSNCPGDCSVEQVQNVFSPVTDIYGKVGEETVVAWADLSQQNNVINLKVKAQNEGEYPITIKLGTTNPDTEYSTTLNLDVVTRCTDNDKDGYNATDTNQVCGTVRDCNDNDASIHPGAQEICTDRIDRNCDGNRGYDTQSESQHGDITCPVEVTGVSVSTTSAFTGDTINVTCNSSIANINSISAKISFMVIESSLCAFKGWEGGSAKFSCPAGQNYGTKYIRCFVDTTKSYKAGTDKDVRINILPATCDEYSSGLSPYWLVTRCNSDTRCMWYSSCSGNKYTGGPDRCVEKGTATAPYCWKGECGATCDNTQGGCIAGHVCNLSICQCECNPSPEICDGKDNDCDGQVDEDLGVITCGLGACQNSVPKCIDGKINTAACIPLNELKSAEVCDGIDNDCNGNADDLNSCLISCTGGKNFYNLTIKGTITLKQKEYTTQTAFRTITTTKTDTCADANSVTKFYCAMYVRNLYSGKRYEPYISSANFSCPDGYGCASGICKKMACTDSDGGARPLARGTTQLKLGSVVYNTKTDTCADAKSVIEYSCGTSNGIAVINSAPVNCDAGYECLNGACQKITCTDSDSGAVYNKLGTTKRCVGTSCVSKIDSCSGKILTEYSCNPDKTIKTETYTCPGSCSSGKCI